MERGQGFPSLSPASAHVSHLALFNDSPRTLKKIIGVTGTRVCHLLESSSSQRETWLCLPCGRKEEGVCVLGMDGAARVIVPCWPC